MRSILTLIFALVFFVTGHSNVDVQTAQLPQDILLETADADALADYLDSVKAQSDQIKACLESETMTQTEMNAESQELYELWDAALNHVLAEAERILPEDEFARLAQDQRAWLSEKEKAVEEAGKEVAGGSIYALVVNTQAAQLTEDRTLELYAMLAQPEM